ncbi:MAG: carbohydrate-binding protein [Chitinivibrionales bacterium]|nr:carbohydrate-binding protein [Chitinivibrionales bacterium]
MLKRLKARYFIGAVAACMLYLLFPGAIIADVPIEINFEAEEFADTAKFDYDNDDPTQLNCCWTNICCDDGGWILYKDVDFGADIYWQHFEVRAIRAGDGDVKVGDFTVHLDSPTGPSLGVVDIMTTNGEWKTFSGSIADANGVHDVYLTTRGAGHHGGIGAFDWFKFKGTVERSGPNVYYVATDGDDYNAGTSIDAPFKSIKTAADLMVGGDICYIREGIYFETVVPKNSGAAGHPITFEAYQNEQVIISAADPVSGWSLHEGNIYKAPMGWNLGPGLNQVFVDDEAMIEARYPDLHNEYTSREGLYWLLPTDHKRDLLHPVLMNSASAIGGGVDCEAAGVADDGICDRAWLDFEQPELQGKPDDFFKNATVWKLGNFWDESAICTSSTNVGGKARLNLKLSRWRWTKPNELKGLYIAGPLGLLNRENEWAVTDGMLYFQPPGGVDPSSMNVFAKKRYLIFDLTNKSNIHVKGIHLLGGSVTMKGAHECLIEDCHFKYPSHFVYFDWRTVGADSDTLDRSGGRRGVYISGTGNTIRKCSIGFSAGCGVVLEGRGNLVEDCYIHDVNFSGTYEAGIRVGGYKNRVIRNTVCKSGRSCIYFAGAKRDESEIEVYYNNFYHSMILVGDGGTFYAKGLTGTGAVFGYNWFHHIYNRGPCTHMYFDDGAQNMTIHHCVFWPNDPTKEAMGEFFPIGMYYGNEAYNNTFLAGAREQGVNWETKFGNDCSNFNCDCKNNLFADENPDYWKFTDIDGYNATLLAGSPAIDQGEEIPGITDGYKGTVPDLGAYEYGGTAWTAGHTWGEKEWPGFTATTSGTLIGSTVALPRLRLIDNRMLCLLLPRSERWTVDIFNARGAKVCRWNSAKAGEYFIPLKSLTSGVFFVKLQSVKYSMVEKILLKK